MLMSVATPLLRLTHCIVLCYVHAHMSTPHTHTIETYTMSGTSAPTANSSVLQQQQCEGVMYRAFQDIFTEIANQQAAAQSSDNTPTAMDTTDDTSSSNHVSVTLACVEVS
jgi:hypothetical protein